LRILVWQASSLKMVLGCTLAGPAQYAPYMHRPAPYEGHVVGLTGTSCHKTSVPIVERTAIQFTCMCTCMADVSIPKTSYEHITSQCTVHRAFHICSESAGRPVPESAILSPGSAVRSPLALPVSILSQGTLKSLLLVTTSAGHIQRIVYTILGACNGSGMVGCGTDHSSSHSQRVSGRQE